MTHSKSSPWERWHRKPTSGGPGGQGAPALDQVAFSLLWRQILTKSLEEDARAHTTLAQLPFGAGMKNGHPEVEEVGYSLVRQALAWALTSQGYF